MESIFTPTKHNFLRTAEIKSILEHRNSEGGYQAMQIDKMIMKTKKSFSSMKNIYVHVFSRNDLNCARTEN